MLSTSAKEDNAVLRCPAPWGTREEEEPPRNLSLACCQPDHSTYPCFLSLPHRKCWLPVSWPDLRDTCKLSFQCGPIPCTHWRTILYCTALNVDPLAFNFTLGLRFM